MKTYRKICINCPAGCHLEVSVDDSGAIDAGFTTGFTPVPGTTFGAMKKGQHGYTLDNDDYKIFYLEIGPGLITADQKGTETSGGTILEVGKKAIALVDKINT